MKRLALVASVVGLLAGSSDFAWGYEVDTHEEMSQKAVEASVLAKDPTLLTNFGLQPLSAKQKFPSSKNTDQDIVNLFRDGSHFEDNLLLGSFLRVRHHFFDPLYDRPLTVLGDAAGEKSPDWALEDKAEYTGGLLSPRQDYSYRDARDYLYKALTATKEADRNTNFGLTFQTLGHIIHHVQDMAQPQHVRNDIYINAGQRQKAQMSLQRLPGKGRAVHEA